MQEVAVSRASIHDALHPRTVERGSAVFDQPLLCERSHDRIDSGITAVFSFNAHRVDRIAGRIVDGKATANCKFGDDGRTLYLTSHDMLARIRLNIKGAGF